MNKLSDNFVGAVFDKPDDARAVVEEMIKQDFQMDQVSILHKAGGQGDDFLGIIYTNEKERFKVWGTQGALWGSLGNAGRRCRPASAARHWVCVRRRSTD